MGILVFLKRICQRDNCRGAGDDVINYQDVLVVKAFGRLHLEDAFYVMKTLGVAHAGLGFIGDYP